MKKCLISWLIGVFIVTGCTASQPPEDATKPPFVPPLPATVVRSQHYVIHSSATEAQTREVSASVEALRAACTTLLPELEQGQVFQLVLYKDQAEFKRHNHSSPWAEAYYKRPYSVAYPGEGPNPHHWMLHEATHQIIAEAGGYKPRRWLNEGLASYVGSSTLSDGVLQLGIPDPAAYPIWWLDEVHAVPGGTPTFQGRPLLSLADLIEDTGPPIGQNVNHYYVAYWSLVHYLLHGDNGAHRGALRALLERGGQRDAFVELVGPYDRIQPRWHAHLTALFADPSDAGAEPR